jgi:hypothetical protein
MQIDLKGVPPHVEDAFRRAAFRQARARRRAPVVHVPERRENVATTRPREHRSPSRSRSAARGDPDPPEPEPPVEVWRGVAAASVRMVQHCERRAKRVAAA